MIRLVTLDLDNTLWDVYPVLRVAEQRFVHWLEEQHPALAEGYDREQAWAIRDDVVAQTPGLARRPSALRKTVMLRVFEQIGAYKVERLPELVEEGFAVFHAARNEIPLYPQAEPMLKALAARYPLIAITNGNADVELVGIGQYFQHQLSAEETGHPKPGTGMFEQALVLAGVAPEECLHVGDHPQEDVLAAKSLGIRSVWFNPEGQAWPETDTPDHELRCLSDLPDLLAGL